MLPWKRETATPRYAFLFICIESQPPHWEQSSTSCVTSPLSFLSISSSYFSPLLFLLSILVFTLFPHFFLSILVQMFFCFSPLLDFSFLSQLLSICRWQCLSLLHAAYFFLYYILFIFFTIPPGIRDFYEILQILQMESAEKSLSTSLYHSQPLLQPEVKYKSKLNHHFLRTLYPKNSSKRAWWYTEWIRFIQIFVFDRILLPSIQYRNIQI